ncbi:ATP-dependent zinc metalloprotease FtsH [Rubinisphaera margarita]|uniref:ATP-dependent zinc metalloprotease FtsH n=1 Tax=Rubinisphaera margarita TaxID=2909586 RepID=UPI001EE8586F|nr:ATP-dependent zinc metalloprotease FtsH [Rubinisphaera margarita]MCG6158394.1 ATP-dependent zinc metalloprotease FtsH [Rubinisphaera margarita]
MNDIKPDEPSPPKGPDVRDQQGPLPSKLNKRSSPSNESANQGRRQKVPWSLILMVGIAVLIIWAANNGRKGDRVDYGFFWQQLEADNVTEVVLDGNYLSGTWKDIPPTPESMQIEGKEPVELQEEFHTQIPHFESDRLLVALGEAGITEYEDVTTQLSLSTQMLIMLGGTMLVMLFFLSMMRRSSDPMSSGMFGSFVKSPAREFRPSDKQTTFDDVAGMENPKTELQEVVEFLKNPAKFQRLGAQIPKGVLLMGSPGTGKTLLARATAGEAEVPFYSINGSEFIQMFVGVGASRVRDLFRTAKEHAPCIVFIDEIDAVGRMRGAGYGGGHDEREQTLNQILSEMDGFTQTDAVIVIAATNRPDVLDKALTRPGRFDRHIVVDLPSKEGRLGILKVHSRKVPLADDVNLERIAASTIGYSGADLKNLVNEAALHATRTSKNKVTMSDFEAAADRVLMGIKREEILSDKEKRMTAYHEAGHTLVAWVLPELDPVHKVTIVPRGRALGVTQLRPDEERHSIGEQRLHQQLAMMLGGRAAEKLVFDEYTANASDDLKRATDISRKMVSHWGMSETIGPAAFRHAEDDPFLGKEMHEMRTYSDATAHLVDQEIQRVLFAAADRAMQILQEHREKLDRISEALIEQEIIDSDELQKILGPRPGSDPVPPMGSPDENA